MCTRSVRLGLISDTHMGNPHYELPTAIADIFADVALILHAGDVGHLTVLEQLSSVAPVMAVHGNDEQDPAATQCLPLLQTVSVAGQRIVLTHGHRQDVQAESASRRDDRWSSKLDYVASFGRARDASIVVAGHTHIPLAVVWDGVLVVNPGAVMPGNVLMRQRIRSVAVMTVCNGQPPEVVFYDIAHPTHPFDASLDVAAGFNAAASRYHRALLPSALQVESYNIYHALKPLDLEERYIALMRPLADRIAAAEERQLSAPEMLNALRQDAEVWAAVQDYLQQSQALGPYL